MEKYTPVLKKQYYESVIPFIKDKFGLKNTMAVPKLESITISQGIGRLVVEDSKCYELYANDLTNIAGQKSITIKAKKSISNFKVRSGMVVGVKVTLRRDKMYDFLYKLINIVLPRVRDFNGVSVDGFDNNAIYNLGIKDQTVFREISFSGNRKNVGLNISIKTNSSNREHVFFVLKEFGFPFKKK
jgi:large subunit ribosomal protein L5